MSQYPWLLLAVYVVTVGVVQLLALWAATSRLPWLLRVLVVWTPIALLATVRAYEPAIVLLLSAALTIGLSLVLARFSSPREPAANSRTVWWRFRLADLLVFMLFLGTWLGLTASQMNVPVRYQLVLPLYVALFAMPLSILTVCSHRAVIGPWRVAASIATLTVIWISALLLRARNAPLYLDGGPSSLHTWSGQETFWIVVEGIMPLILAVCLALPIISVRLARKLNQRNHRRVVILAIAVAFVISLPIIALMWDEFWRVSWETMRLRIVEIAIHSIQLVALAGFIALVTWLCSLGWGQAVGWKPRLARGALLALASAAGLAAAWIYWHMVRYTPFPKFEPRLVNHYHQIVAIARRVSEDVRWSNQLSGATRSGLDEAVKLLRESNYAPRYFSEPEFWGAEPGDWPTGNVVRSVTDHLAQLADESVVAGAHDRAADYAMAIVRFDAMVDHGGSSGHADEGYRLLTVLRTRISAAKARELIELLDKTLDERFPAETVAAWQQAQFESRQGWREKLRTVLNGHAPFARSSFLAGALDGRKPAELTNRLLQTDLAIGLFQRDHGRLPASLAELTPDYLAEVPIDPHSGRALVYRLRAGTFELYSVGPDGKDDGGIFLHRPPRDGKYPYDVRLLQVPLK